jgi:outer membrane protein assembly factor BamB
MQAATTIVQPQEAAQQPPSALAKPRRLWFPAVLLTVFWILNYVVAGLEKPYFVGFIYSMAAPLLLTLLFLGWWFFNRRVPLSERVTCFLMVIATGIAVAPLVHRSMLFGLLTFSFPLVLTTWTAWMFVVRKTGFAWNKLGMLVVVSLTWGWFTLARLDGLDADLQPDMHWRWQPSAEQMFLAEKARAGDIPRAATSAAPIVASAGDWTEYRGPERDGVIHGVKIATNWNTNPPKLLWRQRVGPAWSSVIVIGDRLYTQEQRDASEVVVCYEAVTGKEIWVHDDACRFWEAVSGAGPRATPTFAAGRIYTMGGTGILNCLDAATGARHWTHDTAADAGAKKPLWGFSSSPLVVGDLVIVFAGSESGKSLLAYRATSGEPVWTAPASGGSYSSPQLTTVAGKPQCLILGDGGLTAVDPNNGSVLWQTGLPIPGAPRVVQPHLVGQSQVVATLGTTGISLIDVGQNNAVTQVWESNQMKPEFPDFVVHQGYLYGFDGSYFCCLDLAKGKRAWKEGRYGHGQVVLLAEQNLLLVISETGEAILLAANPKRHEGLGRFHALSGKTWNHPVVAHGRLFARNAEEMACYEVGVP